MNIVLHGCLLESVLLSLSYLSITYRLQTCKSHFAIRYRASPFALCIFAWVLSAIYEATSWSTINSMWFIIKPKANSIYQFKWGNSLLWIQINTLRKLNEFYKIFWIIIQRNLFQDFKRIDYVNQIQYCIYLPGSFIYSI